MDKLPNFAALRNQFKNQKPQQNDLLAELQPSTPKIKQTFNNVPVKEPTELQKIGSLLKANSLDSNQTPESKQEKFTDFLRAASFNFPSKFADKLYPRELLTIHNMVNNGKWQYFEHGNPETFIDEMLKKFVEGKNKGEFIEELKEAVDYVKTNNCVALRLMIAALATETTDSIVILRGKSQGSHLTCQNPDLIKIGQDGEGGEMAIYTGKSASELTQEELVAQADSFYSQKITLSETKSGYKQDKCNIFREMVEKLGYKFIEDINEVHTKLSEYQNDYENMIIARLMFLLLEKEVIGTSTLNLDYKGN